MKNNRTLQAVILGILAYIVWSCGDALLKWVGTNHVTPMQIVAYSPLVALLFLGGTNVLRGTPEKLKPRNVKLEIFRALMFFAQSFVSTTVFTQLPLTTVYAAIFLSPILISVGGALFLKETLSKKQAAIVVGGFLGSLVAINPFQADVASGTLLGWICLPIYPLLFSLNMVLIRYLRETETPESLTFFPLAVRCLLGIPLALLTGPTLSVQEFALICCLGVTLVGGFLLITKAFVRAPSNVIAPLQYVQILMGVFFGFVIWNQTPTLNVALGSALIIIAGVANARIVARKQRVQDAVFEVGD